MMLQQGIDRSISNELFEEAKNYIPRGVDSSVCAFTTV